MKRDFKFMKKIELSGRKSKGKFALVDDEDFDNLNGRKWTINTNGYVVRSNTIRSKRFQYRLHREILKVKIGQVIDHVNRNKLDNRKSNLRICTPSQNQMNRVYKHNKYGFKGVSWDKRYKKWRSTITINYKDVNLGRFDSILIAATMYDFWARELHGEFAKTNFKLI